MIERLGVKEKTAQRLANFSNQKLEAYLSRQRKIVGFLWLTGLAGDAGLAGSGIALIIGALSRSESMIIAAGASGAISLTMAYSSTYAGRIRERIIDMAENEGLTRRREV